MTTNVTTATPPVLELVFRKSGNILEVSLTGRPDASAAMPERLRCLLESKLRYTHKRLLYGPERRDPVTGLLRRMETTEKKLYRYDQFGRLITGFGCHERVREAVLGAGCQVTWKLVKSEAELTRDSLRPDCYVFDHQKVEEVFQFRSRQQEAVHLAATRQCGVFHGATGIGKMLLIAMSCVGYSKAKIHVVVRSTQLARKLVSKLTSYLPDIGLVGAGKRRPGHRITVFTAASLHLAGPWDADLLLCDEAHELLAEKSSSYLARYALSRNFAFTATPKGRGDGADLRMESLFGKTVFYLPYQEAVSLGLAAPIEVLWTDVRLNSNPCLGKEDTAKKRWGLWRNRPRNQLVADRAGDFGPEEQVLVLVDTVEHAVYLRSHLPEYTMIYAPNEVERWDQYVRAGLLGPQEKPLTPARIHELREEFEKGSLKKVIATTVWAVGIDAPQLSAVVRAAPSFTRASNDIMDTQINRASRVHPQSGKTYGVICDFRDQFDSTLANSAKKRFKNYKDNGWPQFVVTPSGTVELEKP